MEQKLHSYRLLFRRFCPLGSPIFFLISRLADNSTYGGSNHWNCLLNIFTRWEKSFQLKRCSNHESNSHKKKQSERSAFLFNSAPKIQCHTVKNTLLQTAFSSVDVRFYGNCRRTVKIEMIITVNYTISYYVFLTIKNRHSNSST